VKRRNNNVDMIRLLQHLNISYEEHSGINTDDFVALPCPYCGGSNPKLGAHKTHGYFTCWSCGFHGLWDTLKILSGIPYRELKDIVGQYSAFVAHDPSNSYKDVIKRPSKVEMLGSNEINPAHDAYKYIRDVRGFDPEFLFRKYSLTYTTYGYGKYNYRIGFPIFYNGKIVSYQMRDYTENPDRIRFMALEKEKEIIPHQRILYNLDNCSLDNILVVEGIFDCLRFNGPGIACSFGISFTIEQANLLRERYKNVFILYDEEEAAQEQAEKLGYLVGSGSTNVEVISLGSEGKSDPDEMLRNKPDDITYIKKELKLY
jgi:hypothetical protein